MTMYHRARLQAEYSVCSCVARYIIMPTASKVLRCTVKASQTKYSVRYRDGQNIWTGASPEKYSGWCDQTISSDGTAQEDYSGQYNQKIYSGTTLYRREKNLCGTFRTYPRAIRHGANIIGGAFNISILMVYRITLCSTVRTYSNLEKESSNKRTNGHYESRVIARRALA